MITIADSSDLNLAKQLSRLLKITIFSKSNYIRLQSSKEFYRSSVPEYVYQTVNHLHKLLPSLRLCNKIWGETEVTLTHLPKSISSLFLVVGEIRLSNPKMSNSVLIRYVPGEPMWNDPCQLESTILMASRPFRFHIPIFTHTQFMVVSPCPAWMPTKSKQ